MTFFNIQELKAQGQHIRGMHKYASMEALYNFSEVINESAIPAYANQFDIFLSHSYRDKDTILALKKFIEKAGYSVYIDWIDDPQLNRKYVTRNSVELIRSRMRYCRSLIYMFTPSSEDSKWMPWELGFMDGLKEKKVAILQLNNTPEDNNSVSYIGREYLKIYFTVDKTETELWINNSEGQWVSYKEWLQGKEPGK